MHERQIGRGPSWPRSLDKALGMVWCVLREASGQPAG